MRFGVKIKIIEYVDDSQPGWVRCVLTDAFGKEWYFTEKVPIVTTSYLGETSQYPQDGITPAPQHVPLKCSAIVSRHCGIFI